MSDPNHSAAEHSSAGGAASRHGPIQRLVEASVGQPLIILLITLGIIGLGFFSLKRLPVDAYPDVSPTAVELTTQWPGHATEEVERLVTVPIETALNGLPNLVVMRSVSLYGLSSVRVTFSEGTDLYFARQQVFERLGDAAVPAGVSPGMEAASSPSGLVYRYVIKSSDRSAMELHVLEDWVLDKAYRARAGRRRRRVARRRDDAVPGARRSDEAGRSGARRQRRGERAQLPTTATPAAGSIRKGRSSSTSGDWDASSRWKTSGTS